MGALPASLVDNCHNSTILSEEQAREVCPGAGWLRGECRHGVVRWVVAPCHRRDCPVCGPAGRYAMAEKIAYGVKALRPAAWLVLTFDGDIEKAEAVARLEQFVKWLRRVGRVGLGMQYVATWEITKRGRLHINLIAGPWRWVDQAVLEERWGARVWVAWVRDGGAGGLGAEVAKAKKSPGSLGGYLSKLEQAVKSGRRVSFSRGWPKAPAVATGEGRRGVITWRWVGGLTPEAGMFDYERSLGHWVEVAPGEWAFAHGEECQCFALGP